MQPALCPTVATLRRYSHGDLDDGEADTVDRHLAECDECLAKMDKLSKADTLFGELRGRTPVEETPHALHVAVSASVARLSADAIAGTTTVGGYTLHEEIGRGGMGQVLRATHPRLPVDVAIKLLRAGHDSEQFRRRFALERETLARMDHPNIAKIYDAGLSEDGRPFLAMELVRGTTLGTYLATVASGWREKLELFRPICAAIQHAHQKGIIHRDLKPSNILLTENDGRLVPKVIDFGVACAVDPTEAGPTDAGFAVGTLQYMSPEQTERGSGGVDTRTDVYSLGVLLYELLVGRTPLAAMGGSRIAPLEAMRWIREVDPSPPCHNTVIEGATGRECEELDWITLKALEKQPDRRYESVAALAEDVRRLLSDEPVEAAPPSRSYRLRKFARRHRVALAGAMTVLLTLSAGIVGTTVQWMRARDAESAAREAKQDADAKRIRAENAEADARTSEQGARESARTTEAYAEFLIAKFLATARPKGAENGLGVDVTVADALREAEKGIEASFAGQPKAEAEARLAIGSTWRNLGRPEPAVTALRRAAQLMESEHGADAERTLQAMAELALALHNLGRLEESQELFRATIERLERTKGRDHGVTLKVTSNFAQTLATRRATAEEGLAIARSVYERSQKKLDENDAFLHLQRVNIAVALHALNRFDEGYQFSAATVERIRKSRPHDDPMRLRVEYQHAQVLTRTGREKAGIVELERIIPLMANRLGEDHVDTIAAVSVLCAGYAKDDRNAEAIARGEANVNRAKASLGPDHPKTLHAMFVLGLSYIIAKRLDDCRRLTTEFAGILRAHRPPLSIALRDASVDLVALCHFTKDYETIIEHGERAIARTMDDGEAKAAQTLKVLTLAYVQRDRYAEAERVAKRYLAVVEKQSPVDGSERAAFHYVLAACQLKGANFPSAENHLVQAMAHFDRAEAGGVMSLACRVMMGEILTKRGRFEDAEAILLPARKGLLEHFVKSPKDVRIRSNYLDATVRVVRLYEAWGRPAQAAEYRAKLPREKAPPPRIVESN